MTLEYFQVQALVCRLKMIFSVTPNTLCIFIAFCESEIVMIGGEVVSYQRALYGEISYANYTCSSTDGDFGETFYI